MTDPVAFQLGPLSIRWYGICVALGFLAGYQLVQRRGRALGLGPQVAPDVTLAAMAGGIGGARLLYVMQNWEAEFSGNLFDTIAVWHGGLVFYGGFLGALATIIAWSLHKRWPLLTIGDMAAPALPLGHALGRLGCLLNGCCFGRPWDGPAGVIYPGLLSDGLLNGPLYIQRLLGVVPAEALECRPVFPIQLVDAAGNLAICGVLLYAGRRAGWRGQLFPLYLFLYAPMRFAVEFGRGDYVHLSYGLTAAQWLCLLLFPVAVVWLAWNRRPLARLKPEKSATQNPHERP
jgi:phosphatidylglycerol:prolipoprotein diacylglycerol transferase